MLFTDVIRTKRDGGMLSDAQIQFFVDGLADNSIPAEQVSALAMAVFLNSMTPAEAGRLTMEMAASGTVLEWQDAGLDGPVVEGEGLNDHAIPQPGGDGAQREGPRHEGRFDLAPGGTGLDPHHGRDGVEAADAGEAREVDGRVSIGNL